MVCCLGNRVYLSSNKGSMRMINLYMRSKIRAHIVHLLIQLNKFDPNPPEIILYIYIYIKLFLTKCASSFIFCFSKFYVYSWKRRAISFITKMALLSLMYLGRWRTVTHCWYQWTTDDHFIYQSFSNSDKGWYRPAGAGESYFARRENFFYRAVGTWGGVILTIQTFFRPSFKNLKSKLAWTVYTNNMKLKQKRDRTNDYS